jgi:hypothetical protein
MTIMSTNPERSLVSMSLMTEIRALDTVASPLYVGIKTVNTLCSAGKVSELLAFCTILYITFPDESGLKHHSKDKN